MTRNLEVVTRVRSAVASIAVVLLASGLASLLVVGEGPTQALLPGIEDGQEAHGVPEPSIFDASTTDPLTQVTPRPSPRNGHDMAYDAKSDRVILFGGYNGTVDLNDTWTYNLNTNSWTNMNPAVAPPARRLHAMAYDAQSDLAVLFGGYDETKDLGDTWVYDLNTNTWTQKNPSQAPSPLRAHRMAYDAKSDRTVLHGGVTAPCATWLYDADGNTWTDVTPSVSPCQWDYGLAYDAGSDRTVLYGGATSTMTLNETWTYNATADLWTNAHPQTSPPGLSHFGMAYDARSDRVILFGGVRGDGVVTGDTWVYDFNSNMWRNANPPLPRPSSRIGHRVVYDAESDRAVLFGGVSNFGGTRNDETWAYDFATNTWTPLTPTPETINPLIAIEYPSNGARLTTLSVTVRGSASDNAGLSRVELSTDGTNWTVATGTTSWSGTLALVEGQNTIYARATDTSGNVGIVWISVTVQSAGGLGPQSLDPVLIAGILIVVFIAAAVVALLLWRRRKKEVPPPTTPPPPHAGQ